MLALSFTLPFTACVGDKSPRVFDRNLASHVCEPERLDYKGASTDLSSAYYRDERVILQGFNNMYHPTVVKVDDTEYPYRMFLMGWAATMGNVGWPGCDATFLMRGKDLYTWEIFCKENRLPNSRSWWEKVDENGNAANVAKWAPVLYADESKWYDNWHVGDASVVYMDGMYYLAYSSYNSDIDGIFSWVPGDTDGDLTCTMAATSTDGINWIKSESPIIIWEPEIGKYEPVTSNGSDFIGKNFYGQPCRPSIMYDEGKWKIWYDYMVNARMSTGYAENSGDFLKHEDWVIVKGEGEPAQFDFCNPEVIKINGKFLMYGDPSLLHYGVSDQRIKVAGSDPTEIGWVTRQLTEAQSLDGINWTVTGWIPPDSDRPANHVPAMYIEDGHLYLFYATQIGYSRHPEDTTRYEYAYDYLRVARRCVGEITWRV